MRSVTLLRWLFAALPFALLAACSSSSLTSLFPLPGSDASAEESCPVTEPAWLKPPDDPAVLSEPAFSYYYVNEDSSIWSAAYWGDEEKEYLRASEDGLKWGWFRPEGALLEITGSRIDGEAPPLRSEVPCCYPTRFQVSGLYFPTEGCWEVTAKADDKELSFVVWIRPEK
jgi:hypothetical protein